MNESKILFNEKCRVCNFEIKHYKKRSKLNFVDCSEMEDKYLKRLHVCLIMVKKFLVWMLSYMFGKEQMVMHGLQKSLSYRSYTFCQKLHTQL